MVSQSKQAYLAKIKDRYRKASKRGKSRILDEFCEICGHHRKHAIRLLRSDGRCKKKRPGRPSKYGADTVAHCGGSMDGNVVWSLTLTDVLTGWTENGAVWNKGQHEVHQLPERIEERLPFRLKDFHSDNGGEFINHPLHSYFCASMHLVSKERRGARYHRKHDVAITPCQRLLESGLLNEFKKTHLLEVSLNLEPYKLRTLIDAKQTKILNALR